MPIIMPYLYASLPLGAFLLVDYEVYVATHKKLLTGYWEFDIVHCIKCCIAAENERHTNTLYEDMTMQNAMMDLFKQLNDSALSSAKRVGELNMKTFETLTAKQTQLLTACFETGSKNADAMTKAKDPQEAFALQQEALKACGEKWLANVREAADLLTATRDELVSIAEEAAKYTTETSEKASELSKQALTENMEKATAAVEKAMAKATEMAQEAVVATKEVADKAAAAGKEVADKAVEATKKAAKEVKAAA